MHILRLPTLCNQTRWHRQGLCVVAVNLSGRRFQSNRPKISATEFLRSKSEVQGGATVRFNPRNPLPAGNDGNESQTPAPIVEKPVQNVPAPTKQKGFNTVVSRNEADVLPSHSEKANVNRYKSKGSRIVSLYPKAIILVFIADSFLWMGMGTFFQYCGWIDPMLARDAIHVYPLHHYIPIPFLKELYVTAASSWLWGCEFILPYRLLYSMLAAHLLAGRMTKFKDNSHLDGVFLIFPENFGSRHAKLGVELVAVFFGTVCVLYYSGFGHWVVHLAPESVRELLTSYNDILRGWVGWNDFPSDELLTCISIGVLFVELFTMYRVRLVSGLVLTARNLFR